MIRVTVNLTVPTGYAPGDYVKLCSNGGSGDIDYDNPISNSPLPLFPDGRGLLGKGHAPKGHCRKGHAFSNNVPGKGQLPKGHFPKGHGTIVIETEVDIESCGDYLFAYAAYDPAGNLHQGSPQELPVYIHQAPNPPTKVKLTSYNATTDILVLAVTA